MDLASRLEGIRAKLDRASEHQLTLAREEATWLTTAEFGPQTEFEERIPELDGLAGLACRADLPGPPPRIAAVCGDIVHNLRSALDHLANALVVANGGTPKEGKGGTQFPIQFGGGSTQIVAAAGGISQTAQRLLEDAQPRTVEEPLAVLSRLSNIDKHRALNVVDVTLFDTELFDFPQEFRDRVRRREPPFAHGDLMYAIVTSDSDTAAPWMGVSYSGELRLADLPGGSAPVVQAIRQVLEHVRDRIVQRFAQECLGGKLDLPSVDF